MLRGPFSSSSSTHPLNVVELDTDRDRWESPQGGPGNSEEGILIGLWPFDGRREREFKTLVPPLPPQVANQSVRPAEILGSASHVLEIHVVVDFFY